MSPASQGSVLYQHGRHRTASAIQFGFQHGTGGRTIRHRLQVLQVGNQADHFHQQIEIRLLLGGDVDEHRAAAPVLGHQAAIGELLLHAIGHGVGLVDLVDGHDDRHIRGLGVIDGFQRLRHHAVIGCNHQHHNVRDLRSAGTHAGEGFVARRIEEHDLAPERRRVLVADRHLVGANMLGDSARFAFGDAGQPDGVEQAGFAVIDMAHDGDHRRTRDAPMRRPLRRRLLRVAVSFANCSSKVMTSVLGPEVARHVRGQLGVERLVDRGENATRQQPGDQVLGANAQLLRQVLYADAFRNRDVPRNRQRLARQRQPWRRNEALHRAFLHPTWHVALSRTRRTSHGTAGWRRRCCSDTCSCSKRRTHARRSGTRRMRTATFAGPHRWSSCPGVNCPGPLPLTRRWHPGRGRWKMGLPRSGIPARRS